MIKNKKQKKYNRRVKPSTKTVHDRQVVRSGLTMLGFIAIFGCIGLATWMTGKIADPNTLPIKQVKLEGEFHYLKTSTLSHLIKSQINGGFFSLDVEQIRTAVKALPWVREATVRKLWPDTVYVTVKEQAAMVRWGEKGFLNQKGELFVPEGGEKPEGLLVLSGPPGTEQLVFKKYKALLGLLNPKNRRLEWLSLNQRRGWRFAIKDGPTVIVGRKDIEQRLWKYAMKVEATLGQKIDQVAEVDLRYTNGFTVRQTELQALDDQAQGQLSYSINKQQSKKKLDKKVVGIFRGE